MRLILRLLANAAALAVATFLLSGITLTAPSTERKVLALLLVALIFGIVNAVLKPIFTFFTAPSGVAHVGSVPDRDQRLAAAPDILAGRPAGDRLERGLASGPR